MPHDDVSSLWTIFFWSFSWKIPWNLFRPRRAPPMLPPGHQPKQLRSSERTAALNARWLSSQSYEFPQEKWSICMVWVIKWCLIYPNQSLIRISYMFMFCSNCVQQNDQNGWKMWHPIVFWWTSAARTLQVGSWAKNVRFCVDSVLENGPETIKSSSKCIYKCLMF